MTNMVFNPNPIPAPGSGSSNMMITVGNNTPLGTYPLSVTGTAGGIQHSATVNVTVTTAVWQQGFDFRATSDYVVDPPGAHSSVLPSDIYPTIGELATYGWQGGYRIAGSNEMKHIRDRLQGWREPTKFIFNVSPAAFYIDLPAPGTYNLSLAMGNDGYAQCSLRVSGTVHGRQ